MRKILEELRGARKIEWFLAVAAIAILILLQFGDVEGTNVQYTEDEKRLASILSSVEGVGRAEVVISDGASAGVLVVAEGAEKMDVCLKIQYAVHAVTGIAVSDIEVMPYGR